MVSRFIFSFYDPAIRGLCLKHVLERFGSLSRLPTAEQPTGEGLTFHFMHEELRGKVLGEIFSSI